MFFYVFGSEKYGGVLELFFSPRRVVACGDPIYKPLKLAFFSRPFAQKNICYRHLQGG
jgi:hypothetical protein